MLGSLDSLPTSCMLLARRIPDEGHRRRRQRRGLEACRPQGAAGGALRTASAPSLPSSLDPASVRHPSRRVLPISGSSREGGPFTPRPLPTRPSPKLTLAPLPSPAPSSAFASRPLLQLHLSCRRWRLPTPTPTLTLTLTLTLTRSQRLSRRRPARSSSSPSPPPSAPHSPRP